MIALRADGLAKTYETTPPLPVLRHIDLVVRPGERVAITGRSGAGKSTLLNMLGLLDEPTSGSVTLQGRDTAAMTTRERDEWRARHLGFVFQDHHVLGRRTCFDNVALKLAVLGTERATRGRIVREALDMVGLAHRIDAPGRLLSGGEKQRLAIARAVVHHPSVILADEPTGNLDEANASIVLELFDGFARSGVAVLVITHDGRIADWADRTLQLRDGELGRTTPPERRARP